MGMSPEEQVRTEGALARRLAAAEPGERQAMYGEVYDEIYAMHLGRNPEQLDFGATPRMAGFLERHTAAGDKVIEIGCGGGLLAIELAKAGREVTGVEVSRVILDQARARGAGVPGLSFVEATDMTIPAPSGSQDFAYSVEVLEHLHEDDVVAHLDEVFRVLRPGGSYWLLTPNRLDSIGSAERFGVADVEAEGDVHLKEWTYSELVPVMRRAGFTGIRSPWRNERMLWMPLLPAAVFAWAERLPERALRNRELRKLLAIVACSVVATKPS
jgi:SAM-dependent methyltransferase